MIDKFKIFNKVKIDADKYKEIETENNEKLKIKMQERLNLSERTKKKRQKNNKIIQAIASIVIIVISIGIINPSLADNLIKILPEFETMLDKIRESIDDGQVVEYSPELYPEIEEEKQEHKNSRLTATPINVSSKSNGLEITLDKAMYDKKKIYLDMTLKTDKKFNKTKYKKAIGDSPYGDGVKNMYIDILEMYINGVKADCYSYSCGIVEFIDEYTVNLSYLIELDINNDVEDANFKINFNLLEYNNSFDSKKIKGPWSFNFNIKSIDDNKKDIEVDKKDGDYTLKKVTVTDTYIETKMELPFQPGLGNPHNNFVIIQDDQGRTLEMSSGADGENKMYTQINELIKVGDIPKYIDILVCKNYGEESNPLSSFRVDLR